MWEKNTYFQLKGKKRYFVLVFQRDGKDIWSTVYVYKKLHSLNLKMKVLLSYPVLYWLQRFW